MKLKYKEDRPHGMMVDGEDGDSASLDSGQSSSHHESDHGESTTTRSRSTRDDTNDSIRKELARRESRNVLRLRVLVILVLGIIAAIVCSTVHRLTARAERDEFESQYEAAAEKVIDSFEEIIGKLGSVTALSNAFTSFGLDHIDETSWPFETLANFQQKAKHARQLSRTLFLGVSHVVAGEDLGAWEDYINKPENYVWIDETIAHQELLGLKESFVDEHEGHDHSLTEEEVDAMHYFDEQGRVMADQPGDELYLPTWQISPYVQQGLVNENILKDHYSAEIARHVMDSGMAVFGGFLTAPPGNISSPDHNTAMFASLRSIQAKESTAYLGDPLARLFVPIFDNFSEQGGKVVGILTALIHWKSYFHKILPDSIQGVDLVLAYSCGENFIHDHADESEVADSHTGHDHRSRERDLVSFTLIDEGKATGDSLSNPPVGSQPPEPNNSHSDNSYWTLDESAADQGSNNSYWDLGHHAGDEEQGLDGEDSDHNSPSGESSNSDGQGEHEEESNHGNHEENMGLDDHDDHGHERHNGDNKEDMQEGEDFDSHFTYRLFGAEARVVGFGDLHDPNFKRWRRDAAITVSGLDDGSASGVPVDTRCVYKVHIYPTQEFYDAYNTTQPLIITGVIAIVFLFAIFMFMVYDRLVEHRQQIVLEKAAQSTAIVSSLFPKNVRERLMEENVKGGKQYVGTKTRLKGMMNDTNKEGTPGDIEDIVVEDAIADLFPACTVFFSDIAGFTAWSSTREPCQVFTLLQTVYQAFDALAKRRRVFKVETIGDSYVAVTGLPDPQERHALIMVRFAFDCMEKFHTITRKLERVLGPDTTELSMRCGLHSGPVTAGVLRGDRARFQLFGDTVNTASRMESTGVRGKIQVSESTAVLLREARKDDWLQEREDIVKAKGKGVLKTFWVAQRTKSGESATSSSMSASKSAITTDSGDSADILPDSTPKTPCTLPRAKLRLVDWIVQLLVEDIKKLLYARGSTATEQAKTAPYYKAPESKTCMDEVKDVIQMPDFDIKNADQKEEFRKVEIEKRIVEDLTEFVKAVAMRYRGNAFHNFDHACHVTMSVKKLLRRIVKPDLNAEEAAKAGSRTSKADENVGNNTFNAMAMKIYDYSHGLSSDPLAMFAMTFSALIHDVDHRGISNMQLATEAPAMADRYKNKSIAEQHSVELAWDILMEDRFDTLRHDLFGSQEELMRFRQLVVNIVLATDIFDAELGALRKNRWKQAFEGGGDLLATEAAAHDLRATIVIEHIIQASDVSHTMQHWHVYQKWNKCLFKEMYAAYKNGRLAKDPATFWYKGELGFFDNYIIPLAGKLKQCGVFGVSSDEYLTYARNNRAEWEDCGEQVVAKLAAETAEEWEKNLNGEKGAAIRRDA